MEKPIVIVILYANLLFQFQSNGEYKSIKKSENILNKITETSSINHNEVNN